MTDFQETIKKFRKMRRRGAVALKYFARSWHRQDRLNIKQLISKKKRSFEEEKLSMEILMEEFK